MVKWGFLKECRDGLRTDNKLIEYAGTIVFRDRILNKLAVKGSFLNRTHLGKKKVQLII